MQPEYNISAVGNKFYIDSNHEEIYLEFKPQEMKGEDTVEIEGRNFKVGYAGSSLRLEGIYYRIHALSSQSHVTLKSIYAAILDIDEEKLDSDCLYKNFGTIQTIASIHFANEERLGWGIEDNDISIFYGTSMMAVDMREKIQKGREKEFKLEDQIADLERHNLYSAKWSLLDRIKHFHLKCQFQESQFKTQLKNHQIRLLRDFQKYDLLVPLNSMEHLARRTARLEAMLSLAIRTEQMIIVKDLLNMGVKPGAQHLFDAMIMNSPELMDLIFERNPKIDINGRNQRGWTFLHCACALWNKPSRAIQWLIEHGADVDVQLPITQSTPLHLGIIRESMDLEMIQLLLEHSQDPNAKNHNGNTILYWAIHPRQGKEEEALVSVLLNYLDPNTKNLNGDTPLHKACTMGIKSSILALLEAGATATVQNNDGRTPLHHIAFRSCGEGSSRENQEFAQLLIQKGANLSQRDRNGETPLHMAVFRAFNHNGDFISYLIEQGADVNAQDQEGSTPLHYAARSGHVEGVKILLKHGANKNIRNKDGYLPAGSTEDVSASKRDRQIIDLLT